MIRVALGKNCLICQTFSFGENEKEKEKIDKNAKIDEANACNITSKLYVNWQTLIVV